MEKATGPQPPRFLFVDRSIELQEPPHCRVFADILKRFNDWKGRFKNKVGLASEIDAFYQAFHPHELNRYEKWNPKIIREIVDYFEKNNKDSFEAWCQENHGKYSSLELEDNRRVLSIILARRRRRAEKNRVLEL